MMRRDPLGFGAPGEDLRVVHLRQGRSLVLRTRKTGDEAKAKGLKLPTHAIVGPGAPLRDPKDEERRSS